ncbi:MAG: hypothetical protein A2284_10240 [Deltaproteobacteria bacterium RIFOXYA12_FULL_61_11]|nr:MAG: hypothetical protein A2284_10240 [Deltaproteobacteria bacterium RIFOXYA12_FULL_61_11]
MTFSPLALLRSGDPASIRRHWNETRQRHPTCRIDVSGADLGRLDLGKEPVELLDCRGISLRGTFLLLARMQKCDFRASDLSELDAFRADLRYSDLRYCNLRGAYLGKTDLRNTDFSGADLSGADLRETDLRGASLVGAILVETYLDGALLNDANLKDAVLERTRLRGCDLTAIKGLEPLQLRTCVLDSPATTTAKSLLTAAPTHLDEKSSQGNRS